MKKSLKLAALTLSLVMIFTALVGCGNNQGSATDEAGDGAVQTTVWKLGLSNPDTHPTAVAAKEMADYIYEKTEGRYKIDIYASSQLGGEGDLFEGVKMNTVQLSFGASSVLANFVPALGALDMPFIFENEEHADKVLFDTSSEVNKLLTTAVEDAGFKCLTFAEQGFRNLLTTEPVETLDDLKGLKIRTMETPLHLELWSAVGASPIPLASPDALPALQQGTVSAVEMANAHLVTVGFAEVGEYYTRTRHLYTAGVYVMNQECYNSLSDADKAVFDEAAKILCERVNQLNREQDQAYYDQIADMKNIKGMYEIPVSDLIPLAQAVYDAHPEFNDTIELIQSYS